VSNKSSAPPYEVAKILLARFASIIEINQSIRRCQQDYRFESHENRIRLEKRVRDLHYETEKQKKLMWSILDKTLTKFEKLDLELSIENFINQKGEIYERHNKRSERLQ